MGSDPLPDTLDLTREAILSGAVLRAAAQTPGMAVQSEAELESSIASILASRTGDDHVWVFGYGSLIWNPAFLFDERRVGRVRGWHRRFCLWTSLSRGSPDRPGLILGLDRGGACNGIVFRIPAADTAQELAVLWRREMADQAYSPRWVTVETERGTVRAVTFTMNRASPRYAGKLDENETARVIATAVGKLGRCSDYLCNTIEALATHGIRDAKLTTLKAHVDRAILESGQGASGAPAPVT